MSIRVIAAGGTIDCSKIKKGNSYLFGKTHIPQMLKQGKNTVPVKIETLMLKDSLYMDDNDRKKIVKRCQEAKEKRIIITHGTDTMVETATALGKRIKNKVIVLVGSMTPYVKKNSDALFNLGGGIIAVQTLPHGVYIVMNGNIFSWNNVRKNRKKMIFDKKA